MKKTEILENMSEAIITGATSQVFVREKTDNFQEKIYVVRGQAITRNGEINEANLENGYISPTSNIQRYFLQSGDVLLLARGSDMRAAIVSLDIAKKKCVASANFLVIRPNLKKIRGEVVVAFLNSSDGKTQLKQGSQDVAIASIPRSKVANLVIPMLSDEKQETIVKLFYARNNAYTTTINLAEQQYKTITAQLESLI